MSYDVVLLSGGFDPLHVGHARMIRNGATLGKKLVIGVNSDAWLMRKKGYVFMPFEERKEMVESLAGVSIATDFDDSDGSACGLLNWARNEWPDEKIAFGNGGDRNLDNIPELRTAEEAKIDLVWGVGGIKIQSSSTLVEDSRGSIDE
jgi:cytidyltransferase-like protein